MKKNILLYFLIIASLQGFTQATPNLAKIQYGETLFVNGLSIEFVKVISDSRCPEGVTCVRAGEAKILINIYQEDNLIESKELIFYPSGVTNTSDDILFNGDGLIINALSLSPYPEVHHRIPEKMYCLDIEIL
ncbi:MAG: hypothetical protein HKO92_10300 [Flavobacteriaceae bacterium]|nr:hypothetical protein [Bacteroidia bacterium]NNK83502.1 hypothetical protein [Flavobacteriaceae bacterium]